MVRVGMKGLFSGSVVVLALGLLFPDSAQAEQLRAGVEVELIREEPGTIPGVKKILIQRFTLAPGAKLENFIPSNTALARGGDGGGFACGPDLVCDPTTQYCSALFGGPPGVPPGYSCVDVPNVPPPLTCETIPNIGIGCECTESDGGVTVTCTAP